MLRSSPLSLCDRPRRGPGSLYASRVVSAILANTSCSECPRSLLMKLSFATPYSSRLRFPMPSSMSRSATLSATMLCSCSRKRRSVFDKSSLTSEEPARHSSSRIRFSRLAVVSSHCAFTVHMTLSTARRRHSRRLSGRAIRSSNLLNFSAKRPSTFADSFCKMAISADMPLRCEGIMATMLASADTRASALTIRSHTSIWHDDSRSSGALLVSTNDR
mmetsp:Transcript_2416/g.7023  ORF Transcript_2416/g.7023 Transcript_2416/m.7023 type:complete len:218 (-) Transcript_2416:363-1016(-)